MFTIKSTLRRIKFILVGFTCHFYSSLFLFLLLLYAHHVSYSLYLQFCGISFSQQRSVDVGKMEIATVSSKHFSFHKFLTVNYFLERCCIIFMRDILVFGLIFSCIYPYFVSIKFLRFIFLLFARVNKLKTTYINLLFHLRLELQVA